MNKQTCCLKSCLLFLAFCWQLPVSGLLHAGAPLKINFQGRLEESGQPAEGAKNFVFRIYDSLSAGSLVWTSQAQSVPVTNGVFSVVLETGTPVNLSTAAFAGARYVEITVNGVPLSPRQEMVSAPYALVAQSLTSDAVISLSNLEKDPSVASTINASTNAVDWTQLKNVPAGLADGTDEGGTTIFSTAAIVSGKFSDERVAISTGAFYGGFNAPDQLLQLDGAGKLDAAKLSGTVPVTAGGTGKTGAAADRILYTSALNTFSEAPISAAGRTLVGGADAAAQRATLGLGALALTGSELDPVFTAHAAFGIGAGDITNWNSAFGWGNHSAAGYSSAAALNSVASSTGTLTVNLAAVALSTGSIAAQVNNVAASTGTLTVNLAAVALSTGSIAAQVNSVAASTGTLTVDLAAVVLSTGPLANSGAWSGALNVGGAVSLPIKTVNSDYQVTADDSTILVNAAGAPVTVTLPSAAGIMGRTYTVKVMDVTNAVTLAPQPLETIDGGADYGHGATGFYAAYEFVTCQSDGANWVIIAQWWAW